MVPSVKTLKFPYLLIATIHCLLKMKIQVIRSMIWNLSINMKNRSCWSKAERKVNDEEDNMQIYQQVIQTRQPHYNFIWGGGNKDIFLKLYYSVMGRNSPSMYVALSYKSSNHFCFMFLYIWTSQHIQILWTNKSFVQFPETHVVHFVAIQIIIHVHELWLHPHC